MLRKRIVKEKINGVSKENNNILMKIFFELKKFNPCLRVVLYIFSVRIKLEIIVHESENKICICPINQNE